MRAKKTIATKNNVLNERKIKWEKGKAVKR
jgi:hypothetical protein